MFSSLPVLFGYFSPETYLPATSLIASVIGFVLMFGRNGLRLLKLKIMGLFAKRASQTSQLKGPHAKPAGKLRERSLKKSD